MIKVYFIQETIGWDNPSRKALVHLGVYEDKADAIKLLEKLKKENCYDNLSIGSCELYQKNTPHALQTKFKVPEQWEKENGVEIIDNDGGFVWNKSICFGEFYERFCECTTRISNIATYRQSRLYAIMHNKPFNQNKPFLPEPEK